MDQNQLVSLLMQQAQALTQQQALQAQVQQAQVQQALQQAAQQQQQQPQQQEMPRQVVAQQLDGQRDLGQEQHHHQGAAGGAPQQGKSLRKGSRVRLMGLQSMPFLNGAEGRIADSFDKESGTFPVELHTPPQVAQAYPSVSVRPANLERLAPLTQPATARVWSSRDDDYREDGGDEEGAEPTIKKRRAGPNFDILKSVSCFVTSGEYSVVDDDTAQERPPTQEEKEIIVLPGPEEAIVYLPCVPELTQRPLRLAAPVTLHALMMGILRAYAPFDEVEVFFEGLKHVQGNTWKMQYGT